MTRAYLIVAGLVSAVLGTMIAVAPVAFYGGYGIDPGGDVSLLNELRSHGLSLLVAGLFMATGAILTRFVFPAILVATALYLSYGVSRVIAVALDGMPSTGLLLAGAAELGIGLVGLVLLRRSRTIPA